MAAASSVSSRLDRTSPVVCGGTVVPQARPTSRFSVHHSLPGMRVRVAGSRSGSKSFPSLRMEHVGCFVPLLSPGKAGGQELTESHSRILEKAMSTLAVLGHCFQLVEVPSASVASPPLAELEAKRQGSKHVVLMMPARGIQELAFKESTVTPDPLENLSGMPDRRWRQLQSVLSRGGDIWMSWLEPAASHQRHSINLVRVLAKAVQS